MKRDYGEGGRDGRGSEGGLRRAVPMGVRNRISVRARADLSKGLTRHHMEQDELDEFLSLSGALALRRQLNDNESTIPPNPVTMQKKWARENGPIRRIRPLLLQLYRFIRSWETNCLLITKINSVIIVPNDREKLRSSAEFSPFPGNFSRIFFNRIIYHRYTYSMLFWLSHRRYLIDIPIHQPCSVIVFH